MTWIALICKSPAIDAIQVHPTCSPIVPWPGVTRAFTRTTSRKFLTVQNFLSNLSAYFFCNKNEEWLQDTCKSSRTPALSWALSYPNATRSHIWFAQQVATRAISTFSYLHVTHNTEYTPHVVWEGLSCVCQWHFDLYTHVQYPQWCKLWTSTIW